MLLIFQRNFLFMKETDIYVGPLQLIFVHHLKDPACKQIIFGNRWRHFLGERDFWEHVGGVDISLDPSSFGQANTQVTVIFSCLSIVRIMMNGEGNRETHLYFDIHI